MDYIPINSVNDIEIKKISVRDINKRYIDRQGNRFATRFNLQKRQIEIVRLARNQREATDIKGAILRGKKEKLLSSSPTPPKPEVKPADPKPVPASSNPKAKSVPATTQKKPVSDLSDDLINELDLNKDDFDFLEENNEDEPIDATNMLEQPFLENMSKELDRFKERQQVVLNQLKNIPRQFLNMQSLSDLTREVDIKCWQESEKCINYFKELYGYPRSLNQYLNRLDDDEKKQLDKLSNDTDKMNAIKRIESSKSFAMVLQAYLDSSMEIRGILNSISDADKVKVFQGKERQLEDLETSLSLLIKNTNRKLAELKSWTHKYAVIRA